MTRRAAAEHDTPIWEDERVNVVEARRVLEYAIRESGVDAHDELEYLINVIQSGVAAYDELQKVRSMCDVWAEREPHCAGVLFIRDEIDQS